MAKRRRRAFSLGISPARTHGAIESCMVDGDDVQVRARVATQVPFVRHVTAQARAGPRPCAATEAVQHAQATGHSACTGPRPRPIRVMQSVF
ncbi:hypothetical protein [Bifidobacterium pseudolongum]|uniref:hypothetical protein n=1 Tax=Bifidobacterium pseudolongum TaxID=1694 RepID=UPI0010210805|nr:hypothetical protein [Bifidobacterium pseudolongum]